MSIKLMSAIFETEFRDLKDAEDNVTKASTAKIVCLALADHANDEGEGAYPGLEKMMLKTSLTKQCIINTYDALKYNGIINLVGQSKLGTNNYTVNPRSFPKLSEGKPNLLVIPIDHQGNPSLPEGVISVDPNHTLTTNITMPVDWQLAHGQTPSQEELDRNKLGGHALNEFERIFGFGSLPWNSTGAWSRFAKFVIKQYPAGWFGEYVEWRNGDGKYKAFSNKKIRENPAAFIDTGYPEFEAGKMYRKTDEQRPEYKHIVIDDSGAVPNPYKKPIK